jgi:hypothetical protein
MFNILCTTSSYHVNSDDRFCYCLFRMKQIFMVPGQYSLLFVSMIEECRPFLCSKEDHTLQYVVFSNEIGLSLFLLILFSWLLAFLWRSRQYTLGLFIWYYWYCCFLILREVLTLIPLESSGYQCQDRIKHPQQYPHFSFLGDTQMLLNILQGIKSSIYAKRGMKFLSH